MRKAEKLFTEAVKAALANPDLIEVARITGDNLKHDRETEHNFGDPFQRRVLEVIGSILEAYDNDLQAMKKSVDDIKESQVKIAGSFRGRNLPG